MTFLEERDFSNLPTITDFFKGKTILITGGSGFLGKVLVEKLLYSCPELDRIYLVLRSKKGVKPEDRLVQLYNDSCFDRLREHSPGLFASKVFFISGDISERALGISEEDRTLLINKTNVVFHVAANIRFDDFLETALNLNVRGTVQMLDLAKEMCKLESFIHVSTSYANTEEDVISEKMYPPHADWREMLQICDNVDPHLTHVLTPKILDKMPNTYVFTKQLAEHVVYEQGGKLPVVIVRPSIVVGSFQEPFPGWIDNFNGPVSILVASGKGILRTIHTDPDLHSDYIPVDIVIKGIITAAWARGTKKLEATDSVPIYHGACGGLNGMKVSDMMDIGKKLIEDYPLDNTLRPPKITIEKSKLIYQIQVFFFHLLPAIGIDLLLRILSKKPMLLKIQRRIYTANIALEYYLTHQWTFVNDNFLELRSKIKSEDKEQFFYSFEDIDPIEYYKNGLIAGRKYLLKEKDENIGKAKRDFKRAVVIDKAITLLFYGCSLWWLINLDFIKKFFQ